jgi:hypothetical protein
MHCLRITPPSVLPFPLMRLPAKLALSIIASLAISWFLWSGLLTSFPPAPVPPTPFERQFGFHRSAEMTDLLNRLLPSPMILDGTLEEKFDRLREVMSVNIFVNWRALERVGIIKHNIQQPPLVLDVSGQTLAEALLALLSRANTPATSLECVVEDDVITISTHDDFSKYTETKVYDVRDLFGSPLAQPRSTNPHRSQFPRWLTSSSPKPPTPQEENALIQQLISAIDPPSWRINGGPLPAPKYLAGQLIITQTEANQRDLKILLHRLQWRRRLETIALRVGILTGGTILLCLLTHFITHGRRLARTRRSAGLCPTCGYDLRATPTHCPECGATPESVHRSPLEFYFVLMPHPR